MRPSPPSRRWQSSAAVSVVGPIPREMHGGQVDLDGQGNQRVRLARADTRHSGRDRRASDSRSCAHAVAQARIPDRLRCQWQPSFKCRDCAVPKRSLSFNVVTMSYRSAVVAAVLAAALAPSNGEATTRMSFSIAKSFHHESDRDYSTVHPGLGATGRLLGEWLRWRAGLVWHSHSRLGPYTGVAATWRVRENWRLGLTAGIVGNYPRGRWVRRGVVPIAQWNDRDRNLVWEFGFARAEGATFVGLGVQIPFSGLAALQHRTRAHRILRQDPNGPGTAWMNSTYATRLDTSSASARLTSAWRHDRLPPDAPASPASTGIRLLTDIEESPI